MSVIETAETGIVTVKLGRRLVVDVVDPLGLIAGVESEAGSVDSMTYDDLARTIRGLLGDVDMQSLDGSAAGSLTTGDLNTTEAILVYRAVRKWSEDLGKGFAPTPI